MTPPFRIKSRNTEALRSQLAVEIALTGYAVVTALLLTRLAILLVVVPRWIWIRQTVSALTDILVWPLTLIPGSEHPILGDATLSDLTAVGIMALIPLTLLARNSRSR